MCLAITVEVLCHEGHRKYAEMTVEETENLIHSIEDGKVEGLRGGPYYVINKNTQRIVGKIGLADNQELIMMPVIRGG